jgi:hypothetical protein
MAFVAHHVQFISALDHAPASAPEAVARRGGILWRIFDAVYASRLRSAEREIARFVERSGGGITDDIERKMTRMS